MIADSWLRDIVRAIKYFNRRTAALTRFGGTCSDLVTPEEVQAARRRGRDIASSSKWTKFSKLD